MPAPGLTPSFVGRGLRYSDRSSPLLVSKKYMFHVSNTFLTSDPWPVFVVTVGQPSPNDSSMKLATLPSQLNVAECQKSTFFWSYAHSGSPVSGRPVLRSIFQICACSPHAAPTMPLAAERAQVVAPEEVVQRRDDAVVADRPVRAVLVARVDDVELGLLEGARRVVERNLDDLDDAVVDLAALLRAERAARRALAERVARVEEVDHTSGVFARAER